MGKIDFVGELIYPDKSINLKLLDQVQGLWNRTRRVQHQDDYYVYMPMELSYEECLDTSGPAAEPRRARSRTAVCVIGGRLPKTLHQRFLLRTP
jgi:hypothetical protein